MDESSAGGAAAAPETSPDDRKATWVVIAAFNEAAKIGEVVRELLPTLPNVVVVDDGSRDETGRHALEAGATVLTHLVNRGQGAALQTGFEYALRRGARYVVTFDADGQHQVEDVPALLAPLVRGETDVCLGSRFLEPDGGVPTGRIVLLKLALVFTWLTSRIRVTDAHNGLRAFSRDAAAKIDIHLDRMAHASELLDQIRIHGLHFHEIPVHVRYTEYSLAKGQRSTAALKVAFDYLIGRLLR